MQLRYLQTLSEIGGEQNSTVVFPMPLDVIKPFMAAYGPQNNKDPSNGFRMKSWRLMPGAVAAERSWPNPKLVRVTPVVEPKRFQWPR
jgi:hypothetical protein